MSAIDDFMSKVIDLDEKEKEETILFLAEALINDNYEFLRKISPKVQNIVLPFLTDVAVEGNEGKIKGGKKVRIYLKCNSDGEVLGMIGSGEEPEDFKKNHTDYKITITLTKEDIKDIINLNGRR